MMRISAAFRFALVIATLVSAQSALGQSCVNAPSGLVAWWPFDEASGTTAADIAGSNPGTLSSGPTHVPGKVGLALRFDGVDDFVDVPKNPAIFALKTGTIEMWVRILDLTAGTVSLFSIAQAGPAFPQADHWALDYRAPGYIQVSLVNGGRVVSTGFTPANAIRDTDFHHIAVVGDSVGIVKVYIDGILQTLWFPSWGPPGNFFFGHATNADNMKIGAIRRDLVFAGGAKVIDEIGIFNRPLSQSEIQAIYAAGSAGKCKSKGMTWRLASANAITGIATVDCGSVPDRCDGALGDRPCTDSLPLLCFKSPIPKLPVPKSVAASDGWSGGIIGTTAPVQASSFDGSLGRANARCAEEFGPGWRVAESREGAAVWNFKAYGNVGDPKSRFWVHINGQPKGTCWK